VKKMIGKVIVGIAIAVLTGGLVIGAMNRTSSREADGNRFNTGENRSGSDEEPNSERFGGGLNGSQAEDGLPNTPRYQGEQGGDRGLSGIETTEKGVAVGSDVWIQLPGTVTGIDPGLLQVRLEDGNLLEVSRRAWWYAQDQGFSASIGDQLTLTGFIEGDEFETTELENLTTGFSVSIRDENGKPLWAGKGG
jgi:hypothetical protein